MKRFKFQYPEDPEGEVVLYSRAEFLHHFPRRPIELHTPHEVHFIGVPDDVVVCDLCNADPDDMIYVLNGTRGYCQACYSQYLAPHCTEKS